MDTFFLGAAEHTTWPLTVDQVQAALEQDFPDLPTRRDHALILEKDYLLFDLAVGDTTVQCQYTDQFSLNVNETAPEACAAVWAWFLPLLPPGTASVAMSETHSTPVTVPALGDLQAITAFVHTLTVP